MPKLSAATTAFWAAMAVSVTASIRSPTVSYTHLDVYKRQIFDGTVEVKAISREAGARTKMAVWSKDPNVNPCLLYTSDQLWTRLLLK